jgi:Flp pilus assembly protein TadB
MGAPRQQQPEDVAQIVSRVGDQGDRVCQHAEDDLRDHERDVEQGGDREGPSEIRRRVAVAVSVVVVEVTGMIMIVVMRIVIVVVIMVVIMVRMVMIVMSV